MAHQDHVHEDVKIEAMQEASVAMTIGALFLAVAGIAGLFFFQSIRSGTEFWLIYTAVLGGIGVLLVGIGTLGRRQNS